MDSRLLVDKKMQHISCISLILIIVAVLFTNCDLIDSLKKETTEDSSDDQDTNTVVVDVTNPVTGRTWMDRNLGASRAATSSTDEQAYGDLYQWGRSADGHQKRNSPTTTTQSSSDQPGHGRFIVGTSQWRNPINNKLWQGVNGINNPCPSGYRLPTEAEWNAERQSWISPNAAGAFASLLKLPVAGRREQLQLYRVGSRGFYWSSTASDLVDGARHLKFESGTAGMFSFGHAHGVSVRCIKD